MHESIIGNFKSAELVSVVHLTDPLTQSRVYLKGEPAFNNIIFRLSGSSETVYNGKTLITTPNSVAFLPKIDIPINYYCDIQKPGEYINICFVTPYLFSDEPYVINLKNSNIKNYFSKLEKYWTLKKTGYYLAAMSLFYEILYEMQLSEKQSHTNPACNIIRPSIEYIHANYCKEDISMQHLADLCNISYSYFKKLFVLKYDITPVKYVTNLKMNKARELLLMNTWNVTQISQMLGYDNVYYFSKVFKANLGCSPTQYQQKKQRYIKSIEFPKK